MTAPGRPWLARVPTYAPGLKADDPNGALASNESALGASPSVLDAVTSAGLRAHRYPDPFANDLRNELASLHGVSPEQILVGNGSDELIFLIALAFLAEGGHAVAATPGYQLVKISTFVVDGGLVEVPLVDWGHDLDQMAMEAADLAYLVNPHNPTGTVRQLDEVATFVARTRSALTVVDEAYIDFCDDPDSVSAISLTATGRVIVLRTFSKVYGLAGLRIGYLIASADIVRTLRKVRAPFSVSSVSQAAAIAAVRDRAHWNSVRDHNREYRARLTTLLQGAGFAAVPSQANFVLAQVPNEQEIVEHVARHAIAVRPGTALGVPGTIRVSVPNKAGLEMLEAALSDIPQLGSTT